MHPKSHLIFFIAFFVTFPKHFGLFNYLYKQKSYSHLQTHARAHFRQILKTSAPLQGHLGAENQKNKKHVFLNYHKEQHTNFLAKSEILPTILCSPQKKMTPHWRLQLPSPPPEKGKLLYLIYLSMDFVQIQNISFSNDKT